jgi:hypothetical protein
LNDPWTTPARIPPFHVDDCGHNFLAGPVMSRRSAEPTVMPRARSN